MLKGARGFSSGGVVRQVGSHEADGCTVRPAVREGVGLVFCTGLLTEAGAPIVVRVWVSDPSSGSGAADDCLSMACA